MKILFEKEIYGTHEQCIELIGYLEMRFSKKKKQKKQKTKHRRKADKLNLNEY